MAGILLATGDHELSSPTSHASPVEDAIRMVLEAAWTLLVILGTGLLAIPAIRWIARRRSEGQAATEATDTSPETVSAWAGNAGFASTSLHQPPWMTLLPKGVDGGRVTLAFGGTYQGRDTTLVNYAYRALPSDPHVQPVIGAEPALAIYAVKLTHHYPGMAVEQAHRLPAISSDLPVVEPRHLPHLGPFWIRAEDPHLVRALMTPEFIQMHQTQSIPSWYLIDSYIVLVETGRLRASRISENLRILCELAGIINPSQ